MPVTSKNNKRFVSGVILLTLSNILVKIIGLVLKIPLHGILGDNGMAYYTAAYEIYVWFYQISTAGLPVAISIMISEHRANGNPVQIRRVFRIALGMFVGVGLAGTAIMLLGAKGFAGLYGLPNASYAIMAIAPTLFFVCVSSAVRGFFQGHQRMFPTALSQLIEAVCKLGIGLLMATYAAGQGYPLYVVAAYTVLGLTIGVAASMVFLGISKMVFRDDEALPASVGGEQLSAGAIMRRIVLTAVPITLSASVTSFTNMIDGMIISQRLQDIGYHVDMAATLFGNYKTLAVSLFNLPASLIYPISYAVVPVLTEALEQKNRERGIFIMTSTFRTGAMIALPCSLGLAVMADPILRLLFNDNSAEMAAPLLSVLSLSIFFVGMMTISNAVLQAYHFEKKPIVSMIAGSAVKLAASYLLIGIPAVGMYGAPLSTLACYVVITAFNFYYMAKDIGFLPKIREVMVRPLLASLLCAVGAAVVYRLLYPVIGLTAATLTAIFAAVAVYVLAVFLFRCLSREDLALLPYGSKLVILLEKLHLMK